MLWRASARGLPPHNISLFRSFHNVSSINYVECQRFFLLKMCARLDCCLYRRFKYHISVVKSSIVDSDPYLDPDWIQIQWIPWTRIRIQDSTMTHKKRKKFDFHFLKLYVLF
jgi:hypothetical protein